MENDAIPVPEMTAVRRPVLCLLPGDGIGREVVPAAARVLRAVWPALEFVEADAGWAVFERTGSAVPASTLTQVRRCGAALFGAVSSPSGPVPGYRSAIVSLRQALDLYANVRPVRSVPLPGLRTDVDLIIFRENTEGLYAGRERLSADGETAVTERVITRQASRRIALKAFAFARASGRRRVTIVHKANVMPQGDGLFRDTCRAVAAGFPDIVVDELLADVAAMWLVRDPSRFDVVLTTNMFGDILSDGAAHWGGGMGLVPSLNWGDEIALAEPVHGSAPDIAGRGIANPLAAILSGALLLRHHWGEHRRAAVLEAAVRETIARGPHTPDLGGAATTAEVAGAVAGRSLERLPE